MTCSTICIIRWIIYIYEIISIPFYLSVVAVLIIKRKTALKTSFFHFCISIGIADLAALLSRIIFSSIPSLLYQYLPITREVIEHTVWQTASSMIRAWGVYFAQVSGLVVLTFNRVTAVWKPFTYEMYWTTNTKIFAIIFQWFFILPFSLPQLHPCCRSMLSSNVTFRAKIIDAEMRNRFWTADIVLESMICSPLLIILWTALVIKYSRSTTANMVAPYNQPTELLSTEKRFTIMGIILCGLYLFQSMTWLYYWLFGGYVNDLHSYITLIVTDLFTCSNPYLLLAFSSVFRSCYIPFVTFGKIHV